MPVQELLVGLALLVAVGYISRAVWRTWTGSGCEKGCGCGPKRKAEPTLIGAEELLVRVRGGKRDG